MAMFREYVYNLTTDKYRGFVPAIARPILYLLSLIYALTVRVLIFGKRLKPRPLSCKVVSVGNITLGGTGKTSLVEYIARYLKEKGKKVAVVSRGYKRKVGSWELGVGSYEVMGDEPFMLQENLKDIPVIVDADRFRGIEQAVRDYGVDTVILDDAMQQWGIKKDLEIVCIDASNPFGNGRLLPRGILREPLSGLKRADIFVLTKTDLSRDTLKIKSDLEKINPRALIVESVHRPVGFYEIGKKDNVLGVEALKGKTAAVFSGIGDPESFETLIKNLGINIGISFRFSDHHHYAQGDLDNIYQSARKNNIDTVITTEKDAVRISRLPTPDSRLPTLILRVELVITKNEEQLHNRFLKLYRL